MNDIPFDRPAPRARKRELPVHWYADQFPDLKDEELADLVASIKASGLRDPIFIGDWEQNGRQIRGGIIDGRHRLKACEIAGVEPRFEHFTGSASDIVRFIADKNIDRRHMGKGQQAMLRAIAYPVPEKGGRGRKSKLSFTFTAQYLNRARAVLDEAADLVAGVLAGGSLNDAYDEVLARRRKASSDEKKLERLHADAPDLVALVIEGSLKLSEAIAALDDRQAKQRRDREAGRNASASLLDFCSQVATIGIAAKLGEKNLITPEQLDRINGAVALLQQIVADEQGDDNETE